MTTTARRGPVCSGGWEAHEAHMEINGDCPWCGATDESKWLPDDHPDVVASLQEAARRE